MARGTVRELERLPGLDPRLAKAAAHRQLTFEPDVGELPARPLRPRIVGPANQDDIAYLGDASTFNAASMYDPRWWNTLPQLSELLAPSDVERLPGSAEPRDGR